MRQLHPTSLNSGSPEMLQQGQQATASQEVCPAVEPVAEEGNVHQLHPTSLNSGSPELLQQGQQAAASQ